MFSLSCLKKDESGSFFPLGERMYPSIRTHSGEDVLGENSCIHTGMGAGAIGEGSSHMWLMNLVHCGHQGLPLGGISCWHFRIGVINGYFIFIFPIVALSHLHPLDISIWLYWVPGSQHSHDNAQFFLKPAYSSASPLYPITKYSNRGIILKCSSPPTVHYEIELTPSRPSLFPRDYSCVEVCLFPTSMSHNLTFLLVQSLFLP